MTAQILLAMLSLTPWSGDKHETPQQRRELYAPVAVAIAGAVRWDDELVAALIAQGWHETRFARYVLEGRCADGPADARCDWSRSHKRPLARGPWQVHGHCRAAWRHPEGSAASLAAEARCAASMLRSGRSRCRSWVGAFAGMRGGWACSSPSAVARELTMRRVLARFREAPAS